MPVNKWEYDKHQSVDQDIDEIGKKLSHKMCYTLYSRAFIEFITR